MQKDKVTNLGQRGNLPAEELFPELFFPSSLFEKPIKHFCQSITVSFHHFYITGDIEDDLDRYVEMFNILKIAEEHDQVHIYLNTPGGSLATTIQIISAIEQSQAHVTTVIEGEVCSAGTLIFFSGHDYIVSDHCTMMIHNYSHGPRGKGGEVKAQVEYSEKYFEKLASYFYKDFLTAEEIKAVCNDKDIWMDSDEIMERLDHKIEAMNEGLEDEEKDVPLPTPTPKRKKRVKKKTTGK